MEPRERTLSDRSPGELRGVLVGCGYVSGYHLEAWSRIPEVEIVAVADTDEAKARQRATEFGIPTVYTEFHRMLKDEAADFIDIATPPASHLKMVKAAARNSLHVLCQKPIAPTLAELRKMTSICEASGVAFMVNENGRFQPWFRKIKALLEANTIGQPIYANFTARARLTLPRLVAGEQEALFGTMSRLIIYELGVHFLDTLRYLFGEMTSLYARTARISPHVSGEDNAVIFLETEGFGAVVDLSWSSIPTWEPPKQITWGEVRVEGQTGTLHLQPSGILRLLDDHEEKRFPFPADGELLGFVGAQQHFVECVLAGSQPETSGEETLKTMELVFAAYESARAGTLYRIGHDLDRLS